MSETWSRIAAGLRGRVGDHRRHPALDVRQEAHVLQVLPRPQVRGRVDRAVVAHEEQRGRVHLEVQVRRRSLRRRRCCRRSRPPRPPSRGARSWPAARRPRGARSRTRCPAESRSQRRLPPTSFQPTEKTVPSAQARSGAPSGAKMSSPWCQLPGHVAAEGAVACRRTRPEARRPGRRSRRRSSFGCELGGHRQAAALATVPRVVGFRRLRRLARPCASSRGSGTTGLARRRHARLHVRLRVADLDLGAGREAAVRCGEVDVEGGDEPVEALGTARPASSGRCPAPA